MTPGNVQRIRRRFKGSHARATRRCLFVAALACGALHAAAGPDGAVRGEASAWFAHADAWRWGARYKPELGVSQELGRTASLAAEISLDLRLSGSETNRTDGGTCAEARLYRMWVRYAQPRWEARLGLQKIAFGPAKILRALMWFDRLDPRDPLQLTDGVWAGLGRAYFPNNANLWVWGLYGNDGRKGLEQFDTNPAHAEWGARCQWPVPAGEFALTCHQRHVAPKAWQAVTGSVMSDGLQQRVAVDGCWDVGPGVWFEGVAEQTRTGPGQSLWRRYVTAGLDYTFPIGPGIHVLGEHMATASGPAPDQERAVRAVSAFSADMSVGLLDVLTFIATFDWETQEFAGFASLRRAYDDWVLALSGFTGPETGNGLYAGDGFAITVAFNH